MTDGPPENRLLAVFPPFPRFQLSAKRTALVVVDMQYLDAHPDCGIGRIATQAGADDLVPSKTSSSPFNSTSIDRFLRNLDIDTLLVCGVVSNGCVEGTIRDASDLGYQVVMVEDACAAVTPALHQAAITNLKDAFCNCRTTGDVMEELDRH